MLTRRVFLRGSAIVMAGVGVAPGWLARAAAAGSRKRKTLVAIFMRGAADGLNIVVATGSPDPSRSHFDAQDSMECGTPGKTGGSGWLNRALPAAGDEASLMRAVAL